MHELINYNSLLILSVFAFITPLFVNSFKKFKIPFVVGEIFVGIIIGKSFFNIVHSDVWITFLSNLGLAYLLFLSGLEIDFDMIKVKSGKKDIFKKILLPFAMFIATFGISFIFSIILYNFGIIKNVAFVSLLFSAGAPGILVPFFKERKILNTIYGQTLLIYSLICEFICLIALTTISSNIIYGFSYKNFLFLILFAFAYGLYLIIKRFSGRFDFSASSLRNLHVGVRAAFALILVLVTISNMIRAEIILGSFLAGVIFSLILDKSKKELHYELDIIGYGFLIPIYFIMVGVNLDIKSVFKEPSALTHIPLFLIIIFIVKFIPSMLLKFYYGLNKALSSGFILSAQLSLLIVGSQMAYNLKIISSSDYSAFILTTVISCILFPLCFDKLYIRDNLEDTESTAIEKISIMEIIPTRENLFNKSLQELSFPNCFRIFLIIRNEKEILPKGDTIILKGDRLLIAGLSQKMDYVLELLNE
ncbi:cation:proton antiporter [Haloimpatiens sp. FM7315]|uniref:cation:proton antiporter n=1 Tax=Haloimpatiens sp. FM7315 TaxID=3298609 RepID=UPI0035A309FD